MKECNAALLPDEEDDAESIFPIPSYPQSGINPVRDWNRV